MALSFFSIVFTEQMTVSGLFAGVGAASSAGGLAVFGFLLVLFNQVLESINYTLMKARENITEDYVEQVLEPWLFGQKGQDAWQHSFDPATGQPMWTLQGLPLKKAVEERADGGLLLQNMHLFEDRGNAGDPGHGGADLYFERQHGSACARHAANNMAQRRVIFTENDFAVAGRELHTNAVAALGEDGGGAMDFEFDAGWQDFNAGRETLEQVLSNKGFFFRDIDIGPDENLQNVAQLERKLEPWLASKGLFVNSQKRRNHDGVLFAHWWALVQVEGVWFELNSLNEGPRPILGVAEYVVEWKKQHDRDPLFRESRIHLFASDLAEDSLLLPRDVLPLPFFDRGDENSAVDALNNCLGRRIFNAAAVDAAFNHVWVVEQRWWDLPKWFSSEVVTVAVNMRADSSGRLMFHADSFGTVAEVLANIYKIRGKDVYGILIAGLDLGEGADGQRWIAVKWQDKTFEGGVVEIFDSQTAAGVAPRSMLWEAFMDLLNDRASMEGKEVQGVLIRMSGRREGVRMRVVDQHVGAEQVDEISRALGAVNLGKESMDGGAAGDGDEGLLMDGGAGVFGERD